VKPSKLQYFFARDWPTKIWLVGVPFLFGLLALNSYPFTSVGDLSGILLFIAILLLALVLGFFVSLAVGLFVLGPLYYDRSRKNGEPFHEGDMVQILVGSHRDKVVRVYRALDMASWAGAHRIWLDLGEEEKKSGKDVFKSYQIVRVA
jgi:hypothetical protein